MSIPFQSPSRLFYFSFVFVAVASSPLSFAQETDTGQQAKSDAQQEQTDDQQASASDLPNALNGPPVTADQKKRKATAAYMAGQAAQKKGKLNEALELYQEAADLDPEAADPIRAQAMLYRRMGRMQQAISLAQKAVSLDKEDYKTRLELAALLLSRRQIDEAGNLIDDALQSKSLNKGSVDFVQLHTVRSRIALVQGRIQDCADSYRVILEALLKPEDFDMDFRQHQTLSSDNATSFMTVGKVMLEVGDNKRALSAFDGEQRIRKEQPGEQNFWIALTQYRMDKLDEAAQNLKLYFETGARTPEALRLLADIDRANNQSDQTRAHLEELAKDDRDASVVMLFLGNLLIEKGDLDEATKVFQQILTDSGEAGARLGLVRVHIARKDADAVVDAVGKALRARLQLPELVPVKVELLAAPEFARKVIDSATKVAIEDSSSMLPTGFFLFADICKALELDLETQEETLLQASLDGNPPQILGTAILDRLGFNLLLQNKPEEAALKYEQLLKLPGLPNAQAIEGLYRLSQAHSFSQKYDQAVDAIQAALKLADKNPLLTYQLGWIHAQASDFDKANSVLKEAAVLAQQDRDLTSRVRQLQGDILVRTRDFEGAIKTYKLVLNDPEQSDENQKQCRMKLSNAYVQAGDMANGEKYLEEVYAKYPDDIGVNNDLGYLYADQGKNLEQAEKMIRVAVDAEPENAAYLDSLGWVLFQQKKFEEAIEVLIKANSDPDDKDSTIIEHLGDAYEALKQPEKAKAAWKDALEVETNSDPNDQKVIDRLTEKLAEE